MTAKPDDIEPLDRVEITFFDAWYTADHWLGIDQVETDNEPCKTIGYFIERGDYYVTVAQTITAAQLGHLFHVPISAIVTMERI